MYLTFDTPTFFVCSFYYSTFKEDLRRRPLCFYHHLFYFGPASNRAIPDEQLDSFVDNLAARIASFDKPAIVAIKSIMNERATLPKNEHIMETQTLFFESLQWDGSRQRVKALLEKGLQQHSDVELNLGKYL